MNNHKQQLHENFYEDSCRLRQLNDALGALKLIGRSMMYDFGKNSRIALEETVNCLIQEIQALQQELNNTNQQIISEPGDEVYALMESLKASRDAGRNSSAE